MTDVLKRLGNWLQGLWPWSDRVERSSRGNTFIRLRTRYELIAGQQQISVAPSLEAIFMRVSESAPATLSAAEYTDRVGETVTWAEVEALEEAVIDLLTASDLIEQLRALRVVYEQSVNEDEYTNYAKTMADLALAGQPNGPSIDRVRSELKATTARIAYVLENESPKEIKRTSLTALNFAIMFLTILVVLFAFHLSVVHPDPTLWPTQSLFVVLFCGIVGGFISVQERLQKPTKVDPKLKYIDLKRSGCSILLSPVFGMIFAVVLFAILVAGLLTGPAFPVFQCHSDPHTPDLCSANTVVAFGRYSTPSSGPDWAKLALWAFAAGFLERLVPDILTRISATAYIKK